MATPKSKNPYPSDLRYGLVAGCMKLKRLLGTQPFCRVCEARERGGRHSASSLSSRALGMLEAPWPQCSRGLLFAEERCRLFSNAHPILSFWFFSLYQTFQFLLFPFSGDLSLLLSSVTIIPVVVRSGTRESEILSHTKTGRVLGVFTSSFKKMTY